MSKSDVVHNLICLTMFIGGIVYMMRNGQAAEAMVLASIFSMIYSKLNRISDK